MAISTTTALVGAALMTSLAGTYAQYKSQKSSGAFESQIYENNARLAEIQAQDSIRRGELEAKEVEKKSKRLIGAQRAALAAQGQDLESGSALQIQQDTAEIGAIDALTVRNNAWREAWGYRVQALDIQSRGTFAGITSNAQAKNTLITGGLSAVKDVAYMSYLSKTKSTTPKATDVDYV